MELVGQESNQPEEKTHLRQKQTKKLLKYATVTGCVILALPNNVAAYWGNLSVYSLSFLVRKQDSISGFTTSWVFLAFLACWTSATLISASVTKRVGCRVTIFIGAFLSNVGIFASYFTVQNTMIALMFSIGALPGFGTGLIDSSALQLVVQVADDDRGKLISTILATRAFGALFLNEITTLFLNPHNLSPTFQAAQAILFAQVEILRKVPKCFLILGGISVCCHFLGFLVLSYKQKVENPNSKDTSMSNSKDTSVSNSKDTSVTSRNEDKHKHESVFNSKDETGSETLGNGGETPSKDNNDMTPWEVLRTKQFYALWLVFFFGSISYVLLANYYKTFGLIWISNDQFLTDLGTAMVATNAFSMFLAGLLIDRYGVKNCLIIYTFLLTLVQQWFYFFPGLNKWVFFFGSLIFSGLVSGSFSAYVAATAVMFGKKHYSRNFGMVLTASLSFSIIGIFLIDRILTSLLWFGTFTLAAVCNFGRLILVMAFIQQEHL